MEESCVIIGASHAGVNCAFALRKEGWEGKITLLDSDPHLPYHRPPLSKSFLINDDGIEKYQLKTEAAYEKAMIDLILGETVHQVDTKRKTIVTKSGVSYVYTKLVLATGARAFILPIKGLANHQNIFTLRNAKDVLSKDGQRSPIIGKRSSHFIPSNFTSRF